MNSDRNAVIDAILQHFRAIRELPNIAMQSEALLNLARALDYPMDNLFWLYSLYTDASQGLKGTPVLGRGGDRKTTG
ncbi:MAG: hypothetical protein ACRCYP_03585 [Alphaproteobacteria bacterium]